ncbi:MAG: 50S ribosomal protein L21 [Patescibacteria group bacterium]
MATKKTPPGTLAVIELSGKQYLVREGDKIKAEKLNAKDGDNIKVDAVLLISSDAEVKVGTPYVAGASVELTLDKTAPGEKIEIRKFRAKSRYRRSTGHRQIESHLTVAGIKIK